MKTALVGNTGFVGSNLLSKHQFTYSYNSRNIDQIKNDGPFDIVIYAGVRAEKYLANSQPQIDQDHIDQTITTLSSLKTKKIVLISTVDVYVNPNGVNESTPVDMTELQPYGAHRAQLESKTREIFGDKLLIARLPALFGPKIKKNFIYDLIHFTPTNLNAQAWEELIQQGFSSKMSALYQFNAKTNFYQLLPDLSTKQSIQLSQFFAKNSFNALNFTDSRNKYSFYDLRCLWDHLQIALKNELSLIHLATEPLVVADIYRAVYPQQKPFVNEFLPQPIIYDLKTQYATIFGGKSSYIFSKDTVLSNVVDFIKQESQVFL